MPFAAVRQTACGTTGTSRDVRFPRRHQGHSGHHMRMIRAPT